MPRAVFVVPLCMLFSTRTFVCFPTENSPHCFCSDTTAETMQFNSNTESQLKHLTAMQRHRVIPTFTYMETWNSKEGLLSRTDSERAASDYTQTGVTSNDRLLQHVIIISLNHQQLGGKKKQSRISPPHERDKVRVCVKEYVYDGTK